MDKFGPCDKNLHKKDTNKESVIYTAGVSGKCAQNTIIKGVDDERRRRYTIMHSYIDRDREGEVGKGFPFSLFLSFVHKIGRIAM